MTAQTLYERLGGYDGITAFVENLLPRLQADDQLGRFWLNRGSDGIAREKQLLIDYLSHNSGSSLYYTGRDMKLTHVGMNISEGDWQQFFKHAGATMKSMSIPEQECNDIVSFVTGLKEDIVENTN